MEEETMQTWVRPELTLPALLPSYESCYVCGQANPVGLHVRFFAHPGGEVRADFDPREQYAGYDGIVHGGVISAFLDELTGWTVSLANSLLAYTADLDVRFSKPVQIGRRYMGSARMEEGRGRLWRARGSLFDEEGQVCARALGRYFLLTSERTAEIAARMTWHDGVTMPGGSGLWNHA